MVEIGEEKINLHVICVCIRRLGEITRRRRRRRIYEIELHLGAYEVRGMMVPVIRNL